jgi:epsilon-lactone hydrolase
MISPFVGTHEILLPDVGKPERIAESQGIEIQSHEYTGMFHDWVLVSSLKETRRELQQVKGMSGS